MLFYLLIGGALAFFLFMGPGQRLLKFPAWRIGAGTGAVVAFAGAAFCLLTRKWTGAAVLIMLGLWLGASARLPRPQAKSQARAAVNNEGMSEVQARSLLGVGPEAGPVEIRAAHKRLMQRVHPDKGGAAGLAAQLNAARDRLLKS